MPKTPDEYRVSGRDEAIERYEAWLEDAIINPAAHSHEAVIASMKMLDEDSVLVCWCKPKRCHADAIVKLWRKYFHAQQQSD